LYNNNKLKIKHDWNSAEVNFDNRVLIFQIKQHH